MSECTPDTSGISSLAGFSYQIRVFVLNALQMTEHETVEFETWDDVAVKQITSGNIDTSNDCFKNIFNASDGIRAIQVKRTALNASTCRQVLFNWMLLEHSDITVNKYILYTDPSYGNKDIMFEIAADKLYSEMMCSKKKNSAAVAKVKAVLSGKVAFERIFNSIKGKYQYMDADVDREIEKAARILFHKGAVLPYVYFERIAEFLKRITVEVIEHINSKQPYIISYDEMIQFVEDVCCRITNSEIIPAYSDFKKVNEIDFSSLDVANSREYLQLKCCDMPDSMIHRHLMEKDYYQHVRFGYMETNKKALIEDIEDTAFGNFESAKFRLKVAGTDTPLERFTQTINSSNSYAANDQVKHGVGVFLTRAEETERLISWEDADNAKN